MRFFERFEELCKAKNKSTTRVGQELGISKSTMSYWRNNKNVTPKSTQLQLLADYFGVSVDYLLGISDQRVDDNVLNFVIEIDDDILEASNGNFLIARKLQNERNKQKAYEKVKNIIPIPKMKKVPLLGTIACGEPILAVENIENYVNMPESINGTFALRCKGDSMINARIFDGDVVFIRQQPDVENGEIAAVLIDDEATLKKVYKYKNRIELRPENPTMAPLEYEGEEMNKIKILGKAVYFLSPVQ